MSEIKTSLVYIASSSTATQWNTVLANRTIKQNVSLTSLVIGKCVYIHIYIFNVFKLKSYWSVSYQAFKSSSVLFSSTRKTKIQTKNPQHHMFSTRNFFTINSTLKIFSSSFYFVVHGSFCKLLFHSAPEKGGIGRAKQWRCVCVCAHACDCVARTCFYSG